MQIVHGRKLSRLHALLVICWKTFTVACSCYSLENFCDCLSLKSLGMDLKLLKENRSELTDKHIHFAESIIKSQYPSLGGLHSTLLQEKPYLHGCRTANTNQIVYCKKRRYWVTVSTKWCGGDEVAVYDSLLHG